MTIGYRTHNTDIIRVLLVNIEGGIAGAEQSLLLLVRFMPKTVQISVACPAGTLADKLTRFGIRTHRLSSPPREFNLHFIWLFYLALVNLQLILIVIRAKPQIIHTNSAKAVLAAIGARVLTRSKLIWHARDLRYSKLLVKLCGCLSSKIIAVSRTVKNKLINLGIKPEQINVVYNGIAANNLPSEIKEKSQSSLFTFTNLGQFVPWKKQLLFIEVAERFLQNNQKSQFILIGDDIFGRDSRYKKELINRIKSSHFASNIKIIEWQDNIDSYWPNIDCLIHTADTEPFGRVIIEAMVHGVPVIAAAGCGAAEIITNGKTGLLFEPDDIKELLRAMKTISGDRELAHNLAMNARQHVISNFQANKTAEKITKVYEELLVA